MLYWSITYTKQYFYWIPDPMLGVDTNKRIPFIQYI